MGEWLMASRWSSAPSNQTIVKRRRNGTRRAGGRRRDRKGERMRATAQKLIVHEVTFEEESKAQVEGNRWRRANHVKWKCTSDGHEGWTEGVAWRGRVDRENADSETRGSKRGVKAALQYPNLDNTSTIFRPARAIPRDRPASNCFFFEIKERSYVFFFSQASLVSET